MSEARQPSGRDGPHVFVDRLDRPELSEDDLHHLTRSLRMRPGQPLTICDGAGSWCPAVLTATGVHASGAVVEVPDRSPPVTIGFTPVKGARPDLVVQKLTELGVHRIVPLVTARSVVRWDAPRARKQVERLRLTAREAAMQSRQVRIPVVDDVTTFDAAVAVPGAALAHPGGRPLGVDVSMLLVGPEGGWSPAELAGPAPQLELSRSVLRAETAAIVAGALLIDRRTSW